MRIHSGPRYDWSLMPSPARYERIIDLARMSLTASLRVICRDWRALSMNGDESSPSGPEMSMNSPGVLPVQTISFTLRMRLLVLLSRTVPRVTMTSVAMNASGGMPTSYTIL